jgi:hypothetical protein
MTGFSAIDFESSIRNWKKGVFSYASTMANEGGREINFGRLGISLYFCASIEIGQREERGW